MAPHAPLRAYSRAGEGSPPSLTQSQASSSERTYGSVLQVIGREPACHNAGPRPFVAGFLP